MFESLTLLLVLQDACRYFLLESGFALFVALLINIAVVSVSGTVCAADKLSSDNTDKCSDLTLNSASFLLKVCYQLKLNNKDSTQINVLYSFSLP